MIPVPQFSRLQLPVGSQGLQRFQQNVESTLVPASQAITEIQSSPASGSIISTFTAPGNVNFATDFTLTHNLGRQPVAIIAGVSTVAGVIYTSPTTNQNQTTKAILRCEAAIPKGSVLTFLVM